MKRKLFKLLSLLTASFIGFSSFPVQAAQYELDAKGNSIEDETYQSDADEDFDNKTSVFAQIGSQFEVSIPKTIVLSGSEKKARYTVTVNGDIAGYECVYVQPDSFINLYAKNKESQTGNVSQDRTCWYNEDLFKTATGVINAPGITAGHWSGTFYFNVFLDSEGTILGDLILPVEAFDENGISLNAKAIAIESNRKRVLLEELIDSNVTDIKNASEIDLVIEIKSDDFDSLATTTFDVSSIASNGDTVVILHFDEEGKWEFISKEIVNNNKVTTNFKSFSPVAFIVLKEDGTSHIHAFGDAVIKNISESTCTEKGKQESVFYCTQCGEEITRFIEDLPLKEHEYSAYEDKNGYQTRHCLYCDYTETGSKTQYAITYNLCGGTLSNKKTTYTVDDSFTLTAPSKSRYTFSGWTGSNGTTPQKIVAISKGTTGNKTYTANYIINGTLKNTSTINGIICQLYDTTGNGSYDTAVLSGTHNGNKFTGLTLPWKNVNKIVANNLILQNDVTDIFLECTATSFDLSSCDTSKIVNATRMFQYCRNVTSLDLSSFDTKNMVKMTQMFEGCFKLKSLNTSSFDTSNVTSMSNMFCHCESLLVLDVSNFNTSKVTGMGSMFDHCMSLTSLDISNFDTSNVVHMWYLVSSCVKLKSLNIDNLDTSNATDVSYMFCNDPLLVSLDLSKLDITKAQKTEEMFKLCSGLKTIKTFKAIGNSHPNLPSTFKDSDGKSYTSITKTNITLTR